MALWFFFSSWSQLAGCGPELKRESVDGILKRVHFPERERERSKRTEHSRTPGEVQRADSREC